MAVAWARLGTLGGELPDHLATHATWADRLVRIGDDCDGLDTALARGGGCGDGAAFRAQPDWIGGVLYVRAGVDGSALSQDRRAYLELAVGGVCVLMGSPRRRDELVLTWMTHERGSLTS